MGAAAALLRYGGEQLINVSAYLGILVGGQLLLLIALLVSCLWYTSGPGVRVQLFLPEAVRNLPVSQSIPVWRWRLFSTFQWGGVAFNLGVLTATFWKVLTYDLAFGWATTLRVEDETVAAITRVLAMPWGGYFAPTAAQIEQSRIVLLEGFSSLDPEATAAWWPFLVLCVTVYGLLPRFLLAGFGAFKVARKLRRPSLGSPETEQLYQRLTRKVLRVQSSQTPAPPTQHSTDALTALTPTRPMRLQLPEDLKPTLNPAVLASAIPQKLGVEITDSNDDTGICFVVEAWQPPLEETLRFFRTKRKEEGSECEFLVLAVGLPTENGGLRPPSPEDVEVWTRKLSTLRDPRLGLLAWEGDA
jgi:hypothetical protein